MAADCWVLWGRRLHYDPERADAVMRLEPRETITDPRLLVRVGVVLILVLVGFVTHAVTHLEPSLVALLGAGAAILVSRVPHPVPGALVELRRLLAQRVDRAVDVGVRPLVEEPHRVEDRTRLLGRRRRVEVDEPVSLDRA